jgi:hypothetical protein
MRLTLAILILLLAIPSLYSSGDIMEGTASNTQRPREEFILFTSTGDRLTSATADVRGYLRNADSSLTTSQIDLFRDEIGVDTFWVAPDTTVSGDSLRNAYWDLWRIDGVDVKLREAVYISGYYSAKDVNDSTSIGASEVSTSHVLDYSLTGADIDSLEIETFHIVADAVTGAKLLDGTVDTDDIAAEAITPTKIDSSEAFTVGGLYINTDNFRWTVAGDTVLAVGSVKYTGDAHFDSNVVIDGDLWCDEATATSLSAGTVTATARVRTRSTTHIGDDASDAVTILGPATLNGTTQFGDADADSCNFAGYQPRTDHNFKVGGDLTVAGAITMHAGGGTATVPDLDVTTNIDCATLTATGNIEGLDVIATDDFRYDDDGTFGDASGDLMTVNATPTFNASTTFANTVALGDGPADSITVTGGTRFVNNVEADAGFKLESQFSDLIVGTVAVAAGAPPTARRQAFAVTGMTSSHICTNSECDQDYWGGVANEGPMSTLAVTDSLIVSPSDGTVATSFTLCYWCWVPE